MSISTNYKSSGVVNATLMDSLLLFCAWLWDAVWMTLNRLSGPLSQGDDFLRA